jgi:hypothetical protein
MEKKRVRLRAVMEYRDGRTVWSGTYECSACGLRFLPDPRDQAKLLRDFNSHEEQHLSPVTREDSDPV